MSQYLVTFKPQEPYFFGNEKRFTFMGERSDNVGSNYFVRSERVPSQSTMIGTLRYILLPIKKNYGEYTPADIEKNDAAVGPRSFRYGDENRFGVIKELSPVFIMQGDEALIPTPLDHQVGKSVYTPFADYASCGEGSGRVYPTEYKAKNGTASSYTRLSDRAVVEQDGIFDSTVRVGINRQNRTEGFFKREYAILKEGFAFAVYAELDEGASVPESTVVYMGQGKSTFTVTFTPVEDGAKADFIGRVADILRNEEVCYCLSDVFVDADIYGGVKFAATELRDYRAYTTCGGRVSKDTTLYKLIKAGSTFLVDGDRWAEFSKRITDPTVETVGYNCVVSQRKKAE